MCVCVCVCVYVCVWVSEYIVSENVVNSVKDLSNSGMKKNIGDV